MTVALTLEAALGHPIMDLDDAVISKLAFPYVKHGGHSPTEAREIAYGKLNSFNNQQFLEALSQGFDVLKERGIIS
jgi:hypothetical protein